MLSIGQCMSCGASLLVQLPCLKVQGCLAKDRQARNAENWVGLNRLSAAQGIKRPELRDELYMQLLKQSRGNTTPSCAKVSPLAGRTAHCQTSIFRTCLQPSVAQALGERAL